MRRTGAAFVWTATALVVALAGAGRALAVQVVTTERGVDTPTYVPIHGVVNLPASVACHDGGCLVAWQDTRTDQYTLWATRLRPDGTPQDPASFLLSEASPSGGEPAVATDGSSFVVVWSDDTSVYATRVDADGATSTDAMPVSNDISLPFAGLSIAFGGDGYMMTFSSPTLSERRLVLALRLDRAGRFIDTQPIVLSESPTHRFGDVVWTGTQYLVAWNDMTASNAYAVIGARVLPDGTVRDPGGFTVTSLGGFSARPRFALGGGVVMMVAGDAPGSSGSGAIDAVTLDPDGQNAHRFTLPSPAGMPGAIAPAVTWNGTDFVVTWAQGLGLSQIMAARVAADRTVLDAAGITLSGSGRQATLPIVAAAGGTSHVVYLDESFNDDGLHELSITADGQVIGDGSAPLVTAASAQRLLGAARGAGQTLLVWSDEGDTAKAAALRAARIGDDGSALPGSAAVTLAALAAGQDRVAGVAFAGGVYLVAWWDRSSTGLGAVRAARVSADGALLDATPVVLDTMAFSVASISVASDGQSFVVCWFSTTGITQGPAPARRVGMNAQLVGDAFSVGSSNYMSAVTLLTVDTGALAAWAQLSPQNAAHVALIPPGAAPTTSTTPGTVVTAETPGLVLAGDRLLLWSRTAGTFLQAAPPFAAIGPSFNVAGVIGTPSWDGARFTGAAPSVSTIYTVTGVDVSVMDGMGALLGGPTTLADTRLLVLSPMSVGLGGGRSLIAYSRVVADSTFGNFQVRFQIVDSTDATAVDGGVAVDAATDSVSGAMDALLDRGPIDAGATTDGAAMDRAVIADAIDDHRAAVDAADAADSGPVAMLGDRSGCSCATAAGGGAGTANQPMLAVGLILAGVAVARVRRRRR